MCLCSNVKRYSQLLNVLTEASLGLCFTSTAALKLKQDLFIIYPAYKISLIGVVYNNYVILFSRFMLAGKTYEWGKKKSVFPNIISC